MIRPVLLRGVAPVAMLSLIAVGACKKVEADPAAGVPQLAKVTTAFEAQEFSVDHPEQYPLTAAVEHRAVSQLAVTGTVNPDITRTVPVISLASGRIVGIFARLGDVVKKGQLLLRLRSDDISGAFANYRWDRNGMSVGAARGLLRRAPLTLVR